MSLPERVKNFPRRTDILLTENRGYESVVHQLPPRKADFSEGQRLTHTGSWSLNIATRQILHSSTDHTRMFGLDPEAGVPSFAEFLQRIHPEDQEHVLETFRALIRSGGDLDMQFRIAAPECPLRYMHAIGHPVLKGSGTPGEYVGITIDTTEGGREREQAEDQLRRSEAYLAESQKLNHTGSWALRPGARKMHYWSDEMFRIWGLDPQDGPPDLEAAMQRVHPDERDRMRQSNELVLQGQIRVDAAGDYKIVLPDGKVKYIHGTVHPIFGEAGQVVEYFGTAVDVTERKRTENALLRSESYLTEAQKLSHTGSFGWDVSSGEIYWSAETFRIFGVDPTEKATIDLVLRRTHPEDRKAVQELVERVTQQRTAFDFEHRLLMPDGAVKYIHAVGRPSEAESGHLEFVGAVTDVSEGKLAEHVLRRSDGYLTETQRLSRIGSWAFTLPSRKPHYWSDELFRIWGFDPKDGAPDDQTMLQRVHPDDRENVQQYLELLLQGCITSDVEGEHRIVMPDGTVKYLHGVVHPVFDEAGHVVEYVGSALDVTERKSAEEALRRSEAYLAEAQKLSHTGSWAQRPSSRTAHYYSEEMLRIWGFDPQGGPPDQEEVMRRIHPDDRDAAGHFFELLLEGRITADAAGEFRIVLPDGTVRYVHGVAHPVFDEAGHVVEYIGTDVDVTERRRAEEALRRSEAYLAEAQRLSHTGSWALNPVTGKMIYYSEEMFRIMGLEPTPEPPDPEAIWQRVHPEDRPAVIGGVEMLTTASQKSPIVMDSSTGSPEFAALANDLRAGRDVDEYELRVVLPDGTLRYLRSYGHPLLDKTGKFVEWVGTTIDVTEQKKAEFERERLRQLEIDLAHMNRISMLGELMASISHELRQPITAGIMSAKTAVRWLAKDQPSVENARQSATDAVKAGERVVEIIERLRSLYTKARPRCEVLDGNKIIGELVDMLRVEANRFKVSVNANLAAGLPMIMSDRVQMQQVLLNLILNAIEAMKETGGSINIESGLNQQGLLQISVSDTGPGLPTEKLEKIFEPFFTTKPKGSGMGLAISRSIVESYGGCLWAARNGDRGACFHFTLPVANH